MSSEEVTSDPPSYFQRLRGAATEELAGSAPIDRRRYLRVLWFFFRAFARILWSDFFLRLPVLRWFRTAPIPRWTAIAIRYRALAVDLGGVLIKLGQYLSTRVDILPFDVTRELAGLQDEVPPTDFDSIRQQIEEDFGRPLDAIFAAIDEDPLGAASLAQVHSARLLDGRPVVVKVLRPGIEVLVETDLRAIGQAIRWLRWWRFVRRRIDLDWVDEEFSTTTRKELDLRLEGRNAERFAELFSGDPEIVVPEVFWDVTARRTLTEENVAFIKVDDVETLAENGIEPGAVARVLYRVYMRQIFVHHYVHADPHPGNLFVKPKPPGSDGPPFQVIFIDFGMMAEIPPRLRAALRQFLIGMGSRDAALVVQSMRDAGYLLPGADLLQLEEAVEAIFDRFWGVDMSRLNNLVMSEAANLWREFGRLLLETPIQLQVDLMFTGRGIELLSGLATGLDNEFNPWAEVVPFAETLASEAAETDWKAQALFLLEQVRLFAGLPGDVSRVASMAKRGRLTLRTALAPDTRKQLQRIERSIDRLGTTLLAAALLVTGAVLHANDPTLGQIVAGVGVLLGVYARFGR